MWTASSDERTFLANGSKVAMLTSSGATRHFVDKKLTPEPNEKKMHCTYSTRQNYSSRRIADAARYRHRQNWCGIVK